MMSIFSLTSSLIYLNLRAPDVAITETVVGAGVSTVFILLSLVIIQQMYIQKTFSKFQNTVLFVMSIISAISTYLTMSTYAPFGSHTSPTSSSEIIKFYINTTKEIIDIPNIVTAILADFRGYDTFGETIVIFCAAVAVLSILNNENEGTKNA